MRKLKMFFFADDEPFTFSDIAAMIAFSAFTAFAVLLILVITITNL